MDSRMGNFPFCTGRAVVRMEKKGTGYFLDQKKLAHHNIGQRRRFIVSYVHWIVW